MRGWIGKWLPFVLLSLPVIFLLILALLVVQPSDSDPCRDLRAPEIVEADEPVELAVRQGEITTLAFGRSYETKRLTIGLEPKGGARVDPQDPPNLRVAVTEFRRSDDARFLPRAIHANATLEGNLVRLRICIERNSMARVDPGTYTGQFLFTDRRVQQMAVPVIITLSWPNWPVPFLLLYLVILGGTAYVYAIRKGFPGEDDFLRVDALTELMRWSLTWSGVVAIAVGTAAALSAYTATYLASPDWGARFAQFLGLIAAMFTAFVTTATATNIARNRNEKPRDEGTETATQN